MWLLALGFIVFFVMHSPVVAGQFVQDSGEVAGLWADRLAEHLGRFLQDL